MSNSFRYSSRVWMAVPLCALGFLIWVNCLRLQRVEYVTSLVQETPAPGENSAKLAPGWQPRLIVPAHDDTSYGWLDQTRQMFARNEWRVRHIDYENAPFGRSVSAASPYRWWLGLVAWCDSAFSGRPIEQSIERAALVADPLLHLLLLSATVVFVASQIGSFPAALCAVAMAVLFPFVGGFIPGAPNDHGLAQFCVLWSLLPLLAGVRMIRVEVPGSAKESDQAESMRLNRSARRWFFIAGVMGAVGLWVGLATVLPMLIGVSAGGLLAAWVVRRESVGAIPREEIAKAWRAWAWGGAIASCLAYLIEFFPSHLLSWQLHAIHPLYGIAWLGGGEVLARLWFWISGGKLGRGRREIGGWLLAISAMATVPLAMALTRSLAFLDTDLLALRLTRLGDAPVAPNLWAWLIRSGFSPTVGVTFLPILLIVPAAWLLVRRGATRGDRLAIAVVLGPLGIALGLACWHLRWWNEVDAVLLALLVGLAAALGQGTSARLIQGLSSLLMLVILFPGAVQIFPRARADAKGGLEEFELYGLIERDMAHWLALRAGPGGAVVLAPHSESTAFHYYGGLRGLATLGWENRDGLGVAVRIASASTPEEAKELIDRREVKYIVIPSWDPYLDIYAQMGMGQLEGTFLNSLHNWKLPPWLRPVPYPLPVISGFEGQSVTVLEVVEDQEDAAALSRTAEYFIEMGQLDRAAQVGQALRRFPADFGAWVARAEVETARGDEAGRAGSLKVLLQRLTAKGDRSLPWDLRVGLAVVLAQAKHSDLAREQTRRCFADVDESKLRGLSEGSLYHLLVLGRAFDLHISDPKLQNLALNLLPIGLRARL